MKKKLVIGILAAGKGTRMNSSIPKVLHVINNRTLIENVIDTATKLNYEKIITIVGFKKELIIKKLEKYDVEFAIQSEQKGTGHAIKQCEDNIKNITGNFLILSGDVPLISKNTLAELIEKHEKNHAKATFVSAVVDDASGYGRIKRDDSNNFIEIIEHKDATAEELLINEINAGIYIFDIETLFSKLSIIKNNNSQGEYYLGDVLKHINSNSIFTYKTTNNNEILGINNKEQLNEIIQKNNT